MQQEASVSTPLHDRRTTPEEALNEAGIGRFQYVLLSILALCWIADVSEVILLAFLAPAVKCDWQLNSGEVQLLSTAVLAAIGVGSICCGIISDAFGRKTGSIVCLVVLCSAGLATTFANDYKTLVILRTLVGFGIGGMNGVFSMFSEFLPEKNRGAMLCIYQLCGAVGVLYEAILAWLVFPGFGWRGLVLASAILPMVILLIFPFLPESPRYLFVNGHPEQAQDMLELIARVNGKRCFVGKLRVDDVPHSPPQNRFITYRKKIQELFQYPLNKITPVIWGMWFAAGLSYYSGLITWSIVQSDDDKSHCHNGDFEFEDSDYFGFFLSASGQALALVLMFFAIDSFGRRHWYAISFWLRSFFLLPLIFDPPGKQAFILLGMLPGVVSFLMIRVVAVETYPSTCRASGLGLANVLARVGAGLSPFLTSIIYHSCGIQLFSVIFAVLYFVFGMLSFLLPFDTLGKPMADRIEDTVKFLNSSKVFQNVETNSNSKQTSLL